MPAYSTVMMPLPTVARKKILGESVKPILSAIPNQHLVDYNEKAIFIDYCQTSNSSDQSFSNNLHFAGYQSGSGHLLR